MLLFKKYSKVVDKLIDLLKQKNLVDRIYIYNDFLIVYCNNHRFGKVCFKLETNTNKKLSLDKNEFFQFLLVDLSLGLDINLDIDASKLNEHKITIKETSIYDGEEDDDGDFLLKFSKEQWEKLKSSIVTTSSNWGYEDRESVVALFVKNSTIYEYSYNTYNRRINPLDATIDEVTVESKWGFNDACFGFDKSVYDLFKDENNISVYYNDNNKLIFESANLQVVYNPFFIERLTNASNFLENTNSVTDEKEFVLSEEARNYIINLYKCLNNVGYVIDNDCYNVSFEANGMKVNDIETNIKSNVYDFNINISLLYTLLENKQPIYYNIIEGETSKSIIIKNNDTYYLFLN